MRRTRPDWPPQMRGYFESLGSFIGCFAETEQALLVILEHLSGVKPQVARALFSGVRSDAATKYITRLAEVLKLPSADRSEFQTLFTQLGLINQLRNDLVHFGTDFYGPGIDFGVTNKNMALTRTRVRSHAVSASLLDDMTTDLETITARLYLFYARHAPSEDLADEVLGPLARRPWRYKPSPPASPGGKRRSKSRKQKRPPRSPRAATQSRD